MEYQERWDKAEADKGKRIEELQLVAKEQRTTHDQEMAELEQRRAEEAACIRAEISRQAVILQEARQDAMAEMDQRLDLRRQELQACASVEQQRCGMLRERQLGRVSELKRELHRYRGHIERVRSHYRDRHVESPNLRGNILLRPVEV